MSRDTYSSPAQRREIVVSHPPEIALLRSSIARPLGHEEETPPRSQEWSRRRAEREPTRTKGDPLPTGDNASIHLSYRSWECSPPNQNTREHSERDSKEDDLRRGASSTGGEKLLFNCGLRPMWVGLGQDTEQGTPHIERPEEDS